VTQTLGLQSVTIDITGVTATSRKWSRTGHRSHAPRQRDGAERISCCFDLSAKPKALPIGTSNKSERLLGYFTWHADDTPPVNPLGDLFKTQVRALAARGRPE